MASLAGASKKRLGPDTTATLLASVFFRFFFVSHFIFRCVWRFTQKRRRQRATLSFLPRRPLDSIPFVNSIRTRLASCKFVIWGPANVFYWVLPGFTGFYLVLLGFYQVSARFYWVLPSLNGFYWVLPSFNGLYWVSTGFYW